MLHKIAKWSGMGAAGTFAYYAGLGGHVPVRGAGHADRRRRVRPARARAGRRRRARSSRGTRPIGLIANKVAPALIAGCTVVLKASPEAPGEAYVVAEVAESIGLPPGVLNVLTADREVSELLVRDPRVDKITFTGSTAAGRRIASICGERIARCTLELGGKSAAVVLDDMDLGAAAATLAGAECFLPGQVCSSLTRIIVSALAPRRAGRGARRADGRRSRSATRSTRRPRWARSSPSASATGSSATSPRASRRARRSPPAAAGPRTSSAGWFVEPTVFGNVDNRSTIAQEEIFGPVLSVIPADDEDARRRARQRHDLRPQRVGVHRRRRPGPRGRRPAALGHRRPQRFRTDFGIAFGGFKQSGIGREGGTEGLLPFLETKTVILEDTPTGY